MQPRFLCWARCLMSCWVFWGFLCFFFLNWASTSLFVMARMFPCRSEMVCGVPMVSEHCKCHWGQPCGRRIHRRIRPLLAGTGHLGLFWIAPLKCAVTSGNQEEQDFLLHGTAVLGVAGLLPASGAIAEEVGKRQCTCSGGGVFQLSQWKPC